MSHQLLYLLTITSSSLWLTILCLPWFPWRIREKLDARTATATTELSEITVLIPARNESAVLPQTLSAIRQQGQNLQIIVIDDQSEDDTANIAHSFDVKVITGQPLPEGWAGKLWALEQGRKHITTPFILLLDADIALSPGILATMLNKLQQENLHCLSLMAELRMKNIWEKLLMPAFIYFFKLLYPFKLANSNNKLIAAAAGGCILLRSQALEKIGGFTRIKDALIDDCSLAKAFKSAGYTTWIGLTHSVTSLRPYPDLQSIWEMVARSAFTQLRYSYLLLPLCTAILLVLFIIPWLALPWTLAIVTVLAMSLSYYPTLRFYHRSLWWVLMLPIIALLYLMMTWSSAVSYALGVRSRWKGRVY